MSHPATALFSAELEAVAMQAMMDGIPIAEFWHVLAGFVGYSLGNAPGTNAVAIQNGVDQFAKMAREIALERFLEARKEKPAND